MGGITTYLAEVRDYLFTWRGGGGVAYLPGQGKGPLPHLARIRGSPIHLVGAGRWVPTWLGYRPLWIWGHLPTWLREVRPHTVDLHPPLPWNHDLFPVPPLGPVREDDSPVRSDLEWSLSLGWGLWSTCLVMSMRGLSGYLTFHFFCPR